MTLAIEATTEVEFDCDECGKPLDVVATATQNRGGYRIIVKPCENCLDAARDEIRYERDNT